MPLWFADLDTIVTCAPGTGSTALGEACERVGALHLPDASNAVKHLRYAELPAANREQVGEAIVITGTRDPWDFYLAEWWRSRTRWAAELDDPASWVHTTPGMVDQIVETRENDFAAWMRLELAADVAAGLTRRVNTGHVSEAHVVIRMEAMMPDLESLHPDLAGRLGKVPTVNRTERNRDVSAFYDTWSRAAVGRLHRGDILQFGYRFGEAIGPRTGRLSIR